MPTLWVYAPHLSPFPWPTPPPWNWGWWWEHFLDHPGYSSWSQDAFANPLACGDKFKVWCKLCFAMHIRDEQAQDDAEVASGLHTSHWDQPTIENTCASTILCFLCGVLTFYGLLTVWAIGQKDPQWGWQVSATPMLLNHLKGCSLQPNHIQQSAEAHLAQSGHLPA